MNGEVEKFGSVDGVPSPRGSYSVYTRVGELIFLAGQVAVDSKTGEVPKDFSAQVRLILENIGKTLESAGSSMDNVLKTTVFLKDRSHKTEYEEIYKTYFKNGYPARSTVIADLMHEDFLVEIEAIAWAPGREH